MIIGNALSTTTKFLNSADVDGRRTELASC